MEKWLVMVEHCMVEALNDVVKKSVADYETKNRNEWVICWPGQVRPATPVSPCWSLRFRARAEVS